MKYLFKGKIKEFKDFTKGDLGLNKWLVYEETIKDRYEQVKEYSYFKKLNDLAEKHNLYFDETEIISWLDSQKIMLKVIKELIMNIVDEIDIIQEFHIPFTNKRADYLLVKDNKIIIIEFSYSNLEKKDYQYQTKLNQVINYKELLSNVISKNIEIGTYTFIIHPEEDNKDSNTEQINNFINYINYFFKDRKLSAIDELNKLPNP